MKTKAKTVISLKNISKVYEGPPPVKAVDNISLDIKEGDLVWFPGGTIGTDVGHRFRWTGTEWVSDPAELPT